jgi:hypothetical protein
MFTLRPEQFQVFQEQAERKFALQLQHALAKRYPYVLPCFPDAVQKQIVMNMINRAKSWGITWQSSLTIFAELMIVIAPNFDEQTEIRYALKSDRKQINQIMKTITYQVPEAAWSKAKATADDLPLFLSVNYFHTSLMNKTVSAMPLVLWDKIDKINTYQYTINAFQYANQLGLNGLNDAPLTLVVWRCLYGPKFNNPKVFSWVNDIINHKHQPRKILAMIKLRIALDHARRV